MKLVKGNEAVCLNNEIQIAAYRSSGWVEVEETEKAPEVEETEKAPEVEERKPRGKAGSKGE